jgi:hypothetical protein
MAGGTTGEETQVKQFIAWGVSFALMAAGGAANAAVTAYACNNCTEAAYSNKALQVAQQYNLGTPLNKYAYIYDIGHGNLRKYLVTKEPDEGGYEYFVELVTPTTSESNTWVNYHAAIAANGGSNNYFLNVDARTNPDVPDRTHTVYEFVETSAYINDVSDYLLNPSNSPIVLVDLSLSAASLTSLVTQFSLTSNPFSLTVTLDTVDNGKLALQWQAGTNHYTLIGALDNENNTVPLVNNQVGGQHYRLGSGNANGFINYLQDHFGIVVINPNTCVNGIMACAGNDSAYSCQWVTCGGVP